MPIHVALSRLPLHNACTNPATHASQRGTLPRLLRSQAHLPDHRWLRLTRVTYLSTWQRRWLPRRWLPRRRLPRSLWSNLLRARRQWRTHHCHCHRRRRRRRCRDLQQHLRRRRHRRAHHHHRLPAMQQLRPRFKRSLRRCSCGCASKRSACCASSAWSGHARTYSCPADTSVCAPTVWIRFSARAPMQCAPCAARLFKRRSGCSTREKSPLPRPIVRDSAARN